MSELLSRKKVNNVRINRHTTKNTQYWAVPPNVLPHVTTDAIPPTIPNTFTRAAAESPADIRPIHTMTPPAAEINPIYNNSVMSPADYINPIYNNPMTPLAAEINPIYNNPVTPPTAEINPIYNDPVMSPALILQFLRNTMFIVKNAPSDGFKCDECDLVFVWKVNLKIHKNIHNESA
eukprot:72015_1